MPPTASSLKTRYNESIDETAVVVELTYVEIGDRLLAKRAVTFYCMSVAEVSKCLSRLLI